MSRADDLLKRFEERNSEELVEESEDRLKSRVICFTKVEILRGFLQLSLARACAVLQLPHNVRDALQAEYTFNEEKQTLIPAITFKHDIELPCSAEKIATVMGRFFKHLILEWQQEIVQAEEDEAGFQALGEYHAKHPETPEKFAKRLRKWCG